MKAFLAVFFLLLLNTACFTQEDYRSEIQKKREEKDIQLKSRKESPLQKKDRRSFDHLNYFEIDEVWRKEATLVLLDGTDTVDFATSSGKVKKFYKYASLSFEHGGKQYRLIAYKRIYPEGYVSNYPPYLFVPFTDSSTGSETYGGGRYIEMPLPDEGAETVALDFNLCFNPYCAYGEGFSCPIPPKENDLDLMVEAGEKAYGDH